MRVINIEYERKIAENSRDQIGIGFNGCHVIFSFYPNQVINWAENGDTKMIAKFHIKKLHNVRD